MPAPTTPASAGGTSARNRAAYANPAMRVSDAERTEVADRLSQHYGDGRLDQEEFDKRLHQAMSAVTQSDLAGLFADLPDDGPPAAAPGARLPKTPAGGAVPPGAVPPGAGPAARPRRSRPPVRRIVAVTLMIVIAACVGHAVAHMFFPWILIAVLVALYLRYGPGPRRR